VEVRPFSGADLDDAAGLLADRQAAHRRTQPLLSGRYEDVGAARAQLEAVLATAGASGTVAYRDGSLIGYLLGAAKPSAVWGPNVWVEAAGLAVSEAEVARDLYAAAAQRWVAEGATAHYALVPAYDSALVDAWSRLAFGQQHLHAIRATAPPDRPIDDDHVIRPARRSDIPQLAALDRVLPAHQGESPVFSPAEAPTLDEAVAEWEADFDDPAYATFVAELDGNVVGSSVGTTIEKSSAHTGLARPDNAGFLGFAAVVPPARGNGLGRRLGEAVIAWAAEQGHASVVTDWRVTNLLSSRTWPKLGFTPTFVRMHRVVGY